MEETKKLANLAGELANVGSALIHKKGVFVLFQLSDEAMAVGTLDGAKLKAEWVGQDVQANVASVVSILKAKLDLEDKGVQEKVGKWLDLAVEGASVLNGAIDFVNKVKLAVG